MCLWVTPEWKLNELNFNWECAAGNVHLWAILPPSVKCNINDWLMFTDLLTLEPWRNWSNNGKPLLYETKEAVQLKYNNWQVPQTKSVFCKHRDEFRVRMGRKRPGIAWVIVFAHASKKQNNGKWLILHSMCTSEIIIFP